MTLNDEALKLSVPNAICETSIPSVVWDDHIVYG